VTAKLIQVTPEKQLWSGSYRPDPDDGLRAQTDVAHTIAGDLRVALSAGGEAAAIDQRDPETESTAVEPSAREARKDVTNSSREFAGRLSLRPAVDKRTVAVLPLKLLTPASDAEFLSVAWRTR